MDKQQFCYQNPHEGGQPGNIRDPFIIKTGGRYYLTASSAPFWNGPCLGIRLWSSDNLIDWTEEAMLLSRSEIPADAWYVDRLWAPEIHETGGLFYLTFNARNEETGHKHSCGIAVAEQVTGPYRLLTPERPVIVHEELYMDEQSTADDRYIANDASLYTDEDGRHFLLYSNAMGIFGWEIALPVCELIGERFNIALPSTDDWDTKIEGPAMLRRGGVYYCFYSSFTRSYEIGILTASSIKGPWTKDERNPIIVPTGDISHAGHNCVFTGPDDRYWIAYHIQRLEDPVERLAYDPVDFNREGQILSNAPTTLPQHIV